MKKNNRFIYRLCINPEYYILNIFILLYIISIFLLLFSIIVESNLISITDDAKKIIDHLDPINSICEESKLESSDNKVTTEGASCSSATATATKNIGSQFLDLFNKDQYGKFLIQKELKNSYYIEYISNKDSDKIITTNFYKIKYEIRHKQCLELFETLYQTIYDLKGLRESHEELTETVNHVTLCNKAFVYEVKESLN
jgi:hypothetical protein